MRIPSGVVDQSIYLVAVDAADLATRETGLTSFTVYRSRDGGAATAMTTPTVTEVSSTNMPGVYKLLLDEDTTIAAGNDSEEMVLHITHAGMAPITRAIEIYRPKITAGYTLGVESDGDLTKVNTLNGHTAQTGDSYSRIGATGSGLTSLAQAAVLGTLATAAATGDPSSAKTIMSYAKQVVNTLIGTSGVATFPAEAAPGNAVSLAEVLRAIHADVTGLNGSAMRGTDSAALASVCTETRLSELDAATSGKMANQVDIIQTDTTTDIPGTISTMQGNVTNILADTNELQTDDIPGKIAALDTVVAGVETKVDTMQGNVTDILADTNELQGSQGDWATATGFMPSTEDGSSFTALPDVTLSNGDHGGAVASLTLASYSNFTGAAASNPNLLQDGTVTVNSQTEFVLSTGSTDADAYNAMVIVFEDASSAVQKSVRTITDYAVTTRTVTIDSAPDFTIVDTDKFSILAVAPGSTPPTVGQIRTEMDDNSTKLAAIVEDTGTTLDTLVRDIPTNTELAAAFTEIKGATWSSTTDTLEDIRDNAGGSAPTVGEIRTELEGAGTKITAIKDATDNLPADPADQSAIEAAITSAHSTTDGRIDTVDTAVSAIKAVTDLLPDGGALDDLALILADTDELQTDNIPALIALLPTATENALALLKYDFNGITGEAARSALNALRFLRNKWTTTGGILTVTKEDDTTEAWTAALTSDAAADPITGSDPT